MFIWQVIRQMGIFFLLFKGNFSINDNYFKSFYTLHLVLKPICLKVLNYKKQESLPCIFLLSKINMVYFRWGSISGLAKRASFCLAFIVLISSPLFAFSYFSVRHFQPSFPHDCFSFSFYVFFCFFFHSWIQWQFLFWTN